MGLRPCGPQVVVFSWSPQLLDLFSWSGSWTFRSWLLRPVHERRTRIKYVIGLTGLAEVFRHSWYQSKKFMEWLIEEIGVVEEMIQRKVPSV
ncbi:hypothetical protein Taro_004852 [Colocasia esculenta]|uniref:Uncharacterized protein n=1 Tax=Colocasia esculenta TaxID=4460 RepID=A0A843TLD5_COLES|nr:hypothetical protein [Colocasia esculenta]